MLLKLFWLLFVVAMGFSLWGVAKVMGSGAVGGVIALIFPVLLLVMGLIVLFTQHKVVLISFSAILGWGLLIVAWGFATYAMERDPRLESPANAFKDPQVRTLIDLIHSGQVDLLRPRLAAAPKSVVNGVYDGKTMLVFALWHASENRTEIVKMLLEAGADPNLRSQDNLPLNDVNATDSSLIPLLLAAGADPNLKQYGAPVWWRMINNQPESLPMLEYFLTHGADVSLRNDDGESAIVEAARREWVAVPMLLKHGVAWKNERLIDQTVYRALEN